jgi:hypothetical protein
VGDWLLGVRGGEGEGDAVGEEAKGKWIPTLHCQGSTNGSHAHNSTL